MNLSDFHTLSHQQKIDTLYQQGVYIGKRKLEELTVLLFQLESFYVEVFYKKYRTHFIHLNCSGSTSLLDPYLSQIEVEHLVYTQQAKS
jgi:hypothetical protein